MTLSQPKARPMPTRTSWRLRLIGGTLLFIGLPLTWALLSEQRATLTNWLSPQEVELFVSDKRTSGDFSIDLEKVYPRLSQRRDGVRVTVRQVARDELLHTSAQLLDKFAQTQNAGESSKLFVELLPPYSCNKKILRNEIDQQTRFAGEGRVALLRRVVVIIGASADAAEDRCSPGVNDPCNRLGLDWAYATWSFGGVGLAIDEQTMSLVGKCLPALFKPT